MLESKYTVRTWWVQSYDSEKHRLYNVIREVSYLCVVLYRTRQQHPPQHAYLVYGVCNEYELRAKKHVLRLDRYRAGGVELVGARVGLKVNVVTVLRHSHIATGETHTGQSRRCLKPSF